MINYLAIGCGSFIFLILFVLNQKSSDLKNILSFDFTEMKCKPLVDSLCLLVRFIFNTEVWFGQQGFFFNPHIWNSFRSEKRSKTFVHCNLGPINQILPPFHILPSYFISYPPPINKPLLIQYCILWYCGKIISIYYSIGKRH